MEKEDINKNKENNILDVIDIYKYNFNIIELEEIDKIDENDDEEINKSYKENMDDNLKIIKNYEKNRKSIYNEIINESKKIYKMGNLKLIKRLMYEILYIEKINFSETYTIFNSMKNIIYIFEDYAWNIISILIQTFLMNY